MQNIVFYIAKSLRFILNYFSKIVSSYFSRIKFYINNVEFKEIKSNGVPYVMVARGGCFKIGHSFRINNGLKGNPIGRPQKCVFFVNKGAFLVIGNNVGISSTAIIVTSKITIGNNVKIGGGVCIYDTDFHSLDPKLRNNNLIDINNRISKPVFIKENVFIGAHSTILKGVTIGKNSIIGACSVVTKSIPDNEIWAGNPAHYIKSI